MQIAGGSRRIQTLHMVDLYYPHARQAHLEQQSQITTLKFSKFKKGRLLKGYNHKKEKGEKKEEKV